MKLSKEFRTNENRINSAYKKSCDGLVIPMMSIPSIFKHGHAVIAQGADDVALGAAIFAFVKNLAVN